MTLYIGVDIHARPQTVSYLDTEDGSMEQRQLHHERDDIRAFYSQFKGEVIVGIEACGYTNWFEELIEGLGHKLLVGDAAEIRRLARRRQKNDRRDAELLLKLWIGLLVFPVLGYLMGDLSSKAMKAAYGVLLIVQCAYGIVGANVKRGP